MCSDQILSVPDNKSGDTLLRKLMLNSIVPPSCLFKLADALFWYRRSKHVQLNPPFLQLAKYDRQAHEPLRRPELW